MVGRKTALELRIAARYLRSFGRTAMEFDSPEALQKYLRDHPGADKSLHSVKKPGDGKAKGEEKSKAEDKGQEGKETPKKTFKERLQSLSQKAKSFISNAPKEVKQFIQDDAHRRTTLMAMHKVVENLPANVYKNAKKAVKHEVHEFKTAGQGIRAVLKGEKMTPEQKKAVKVVAFDVALTVATVAVTGGLGAGVSGMAGKSASSFATALAKKIALKTVTEGLGHLTTIEELGHFGHGLKEVVEHVLTASENAPEADEGDLMTAYIMKLVADQLKNLDPDTLAAAIEEAADEKD